MGPSMKKVRMKQFQAKATKHQIQMKIMMEFFLRLLALVEGILRVLVLEEDLLCLLRMEKVIPPVL